MLTHLSNWCQSKPDWLPLTVHTYSFAGTAVWDYLGRACALCDIFSMIFFPTVVVKPARILLRRDVSGTGGGGFGGRWAGGFGCPPPSPAHTLTTTARRPRISPGVQRPIEIGSAGNTISPWVVTRDDQYQNFDSNTNKVVNYFYNSSSNTNSIGNIFFNSSSNTNFQS